MPRKKISEVEMQAVAYLYSKDHSRDDIRHILKLSQPSVSRSIKQAMQKGWLKSTIQFVEESIPDGRMQEIDALVSPQRHLTEQFKEFARKHEEVTILPDLRVLPSANRSTDADLWQERLEQFGNIAAAHIRELLLPAKKCGISWGYTSTSIARGLRKLGPSPLRKGEPITFIALCGEPLRKPRGKATTQISSSSLAEQFAQIINGSPEHSYTLSAVPAIILEDDEKNAGIIHDFFKRSATEYRQIFYGDSENGQPKALIDELDTILTSVGAPTHPHGYWGDSLIATEGINWERVKRLIIGDIGGVLFPRPGLGINEEEELQKLNNRWMGIKEQHMKQCAEKALDNRTAGVIVVAIGANKAASVSESVRRGLVNTLIIDRDLADALLQEL